MPNITVRNGEIGLTKQGGVAGPKGFPALAKIDIRNRYPEKGMVSCGVPLAFWVMRSKSPVTFHSFNGTRFEKQPVTPDKIIDIPAGIKFCIVGQKVSILLASQKAFKFKVIETVK